MEQCIPFSKRLDIATGYFEIGSLLLLDGTWQKLNEIRILFGDEVTKRTKDVFVKMLEDLKKNIDSGIEDDKEKNEFLVGIPAIIDAMKSGKIKCRIYNKEKFHAKAYILYLPESEQAKVFGQKSQFALVGSSNFTKPGLTQNIELNIQFHDDVDQIKDWYEKMWEEGTDINADLLTVIEKHVKEYSPYDVYVRSMYEYFHNQEKSVTEWEQYDSKIFNLLSQYQKDGYNNLIKIANRYSGAFLCDGVGLGKTYVGLMLLERFVKKENKSVVLLVPASARIAVWEAALKKFLPELLDGFFSFKIMNHTDLIREKHQNLLSQVRQFADVVIIDEAHHFRNRSGQGYRKLYEMMGGKKKQLYMLTATPLNNSFMDILHQIELFSQRQENYFAQTLGINFLRRHFIELDKKLDEANTVSKTSSSQNILSSNQFSSDPIVKELVVQRSRAYVKESLKNSNKDNTILFPERQPPIVGKYSLKKSYSSLIDDFTKAFDREYNGKKICLLSLPFYAPFEPQYFKGDLSQVDAMVSGRQQQVVSLIRLLMLKRFESSAEAFKETCIKLFVKVWKFIDDYKDNISERKLEKFHAQYDEIRDYVEHYYKAHETTIEDIEEDLPDYIWNDEEYNEGINLADFDFEAMIEDAIDDIEQLSKFINDLKNVDPEEDDKINTLIELLRNDDKVKGKQVIIFSEFTATARYIENRLKQAGFNNVMEIDGSDNDKEETVFRFAPYYNGAEPNKENPIQILVATDVLAEGLNLQDASCLINYELHWNPVRLMQRIGRVDRRRNKEIEDKIIADKPELAKDRNNVYIWNFLPPDELNEILSLYKTVTRKTLAISLTFGIEGKKLLTPDDEYNALQNFNSEYDGQKTRIEEMALEYQKLMIANPDYEKNISKLPLRMYSGKTPSIQKGVFFCYKLPARDDNGIWSDDNGIIRWAFYNTEKDKLIDSTEKAYEIWQSIKCESDENRMFNMTQDRFNELNQKIRRHFDRTYMLQMQVPTGLKMKLLTWMQVE
ncbi:MAG: DEAD/DEAH box helicase family protein [Treponema sp.]|nr:DEAD/DEAH box helicase family protein [Candidatus Treponema equifaecale]